MNSPKMINFVTVNYNSSSLIKELYSSILNNKYSNIQIIIVNNSPEDKLIQEYGKQKYIKIINSQDNLGFGKACNLALQYIYKLDSEALVWLINPDALLDKDAVNYITECFNKISNIAILGTKIRDSYGKIWFDRGIFNPHTGYLNHKIRVSEDMSDLIGTTRCRWVSGCSLIINFSLFDHCPRFEPNYFLYCEDADLCERYYQQGYHIAVTNKVLVTHQVSAIIGRNRIFMFQNYTFSRLFFLKRHAKIWGLLLYLIYLIIKITVLLPIDNSNALGRWRGLKKFLQEAT